MSVGIPLSCHIEAVFDPPGNVRSLFAIPEESSSVESSGASCEGCEMSSLNTHPHLPLACSRSVEEEALPLQKQSPHPSSLSLGTALKEPQITWELIIE